MGKALTWTGLAVVALGGILSATQTDAYGVYLVGGLIIGLPLALGGVVSWMSYDADEDIGRNYGLQSTRPVPTRAFSGYVPPIPQPLTYSVRLAF